MPSVSDKQARFMRAVANNPDFAKKVGVPKAVGEDYMEADKGKKLGPVNRPDLQGVNKPKTNHGEMNLFKKGGVMKESKSEMKKEMAADKKQDVAMIKKAFKEHDAQEHKGQKGTKIVLKKGGDVKKYAAGGKIQAEMNKQLPKGVDKKGIVPESKQMGMLGMKSGGMAKVRKTEMVKMASGGSVKEARMEPAKMGKVARMDAGPAKKESRLEPASMGKVKTNSSPDGIATKGRTRGRYL